MIVISKENLIYNDYQWTYYSCCHPKINGIFDHTELNIQEGYELLFFINKISAQWGFSSVEKCLKMERLIHEYLPQKIQTRESLYLWILSQWNRINELL